MRIARVLVPIVLVAGAGTALACIWDTDTVKAESEGLPDIQKVIVGSFPRNPPLYYEMRLKRAAAAVAKDADAFEAYDDAGAACDRLGRGDEAIAWMEKKRARLDLGKDDGPGKRYTTHRYRYLANVGTFWAHRWLRGGKDRAKIDQMKTAAAFIRKAIQLNPDAHFGRERYQLKAMEWIAADKGWKAPEKGRAFLGDFLGLTAQSRLMHNTKSRGDLKKLGYEDAIEGLSGLIVLGNAWESVDVFHALALALQIDGRSSLAYLAKLRAQELVAAGRGSIRPGAPKGDQLRGMVGVAWTLVDKDVQKRLSKQFRAGREKADAWQAKRTQFMLKRLAEGKHPDTHPDFWQVRKEREGRRAPPGSSRRGDGNPKGGGR